MSLYHHTFIFFTFCDKDLTVGQKMLQKYCKGPVTYATSLDVDQIYNISHINILTLFQMYVNAAVIRPWGLTEGLNSE